MLATQKVTDADFGGTVDAQVIDRSDHASDEALTQQTVQVCADLAKIDAPKPIIRRAAAQALRDAGMTASASPAQKCAAVFHYAKRNVRYVLEAQLLEGPFNLQMDRELDQMLIAPATLLQMPTPQGDCTTYSMLVVAMLRTLGIGSSLKTIAADPQQPDAYTHVYVIAHPPGRDVPLDASNGTQPDHEYKGKVFKARVWPIDGKKAPAPARLQGLADGEDSSGFDWGDLLQSTVSDIAAPILKAQFAVPNIPRGTTFQTRNKDGSITQISSAGAPLTLNSLGTGSGSNLLLYGGVGLVALLLVMRR